MEIMYQLLFYYKWHYRYLKLMYRQMTYYQDLELNNPHKQVHYFVDG